ncbi:hypothetical protein UFOVP920_4 [uncultured Caudovirales phage]|uniref:Uncharacterized protein n=1 Tax=uncultured Caudovirales phage TaxID=2100421 RepID=A0A6J5PVP2_9CAUD|nr:hypothetical protein UFOVP920_4 [uncultured Caudovirales phage]CAB4199674.1 hypothetical protein UFOVP1345_4 [uncultured Caudovirales phage]CAB5228585.1 hypothetical protein UFOVP1542_4 [uncultured Caudovirales phage]
MKTLACYRVQARSPQLKSRECKGTLTRMYFTRHHADQMARALTLNGMETTVDAISLPDDALTRLTVSP